MAPQKRVHFGSSGGLGDIWADLRPGPDPGFLDGIRALGLPAAVRGCAPVKILLRQSGSCEEVLAFSRQPIVHPKDRGAAWVSKEVDSDLSCCGMWECHNYCAPQILLLPKWQELLSRSKRGGEATA